MPIDFILFNCWINPEFLCGYKLPIETTDKAQSLVKLRFALTIEKLRSKKSSENKKLPIYGEKRLHRLQLAITY